MDWKTLIASVIQVVVRLLPLPTKARKQRRDKTKTDKTDK